MISVDIRYSSLSIKNPTPSVDVRLDVNLKEVTMKEAEEFLQQIRILVEEFNQKENNDADR